MDMKNHFFTSLLAKLFLPKSVQTNTSRKVVRTKKLANPAYPLNRLVVYPNSGFVSATQPGSNYRNRENWLTVCASPLGDGAVV